MHNVFAAVAEEIFRGDVTWGRIVALFAMTGALAMDCVKGGHPEYVLGLVQRMGIFVERDLAPWICQQGGWVSTSVDIFFSLQSKHKFKKNIEHIV